MRLRYAAAITAALVLALTGAALAASPFTKITGGKTTLTLSSAAVNAASSAHITGAAIAPATVSGATSTFPIAGGQVNLSNLHGVIRLKGGFKLTDGTKSGTVRSLTIEAYGKTADLYGVVRGGTVRRCSVVGHVPHRRVICRNVVRSAVVRLAHITGVKQSGAGATGTAALTAASAKLLDQLSGGKTFKAGQVLGAVTVTPTLAGTTTTTTTTTTSTTKSA
jgi:hypothetical protein